MKLLSVTILAMSVCFSNQIVAAENAASFLDDLLREPAPTNTTNRVKLGTPFRLTPPSNNLTFKQFVFPTNFLGIFTNGAPLVFSGTNRVLTLPSGKSPQPGVYKTEPFACIVVVPASHPDERMVMNPGKAETKMPMIEPPFKFVPLARKEN